MRSIVVVSGIYFHIKTDRVLLPANIRLRFKIVVPRHVLCFGPVRLIGAASHILGVFHGKHIYYIDQPQQRWYSEHRHLIVIQFRTD